MQGDEPIDRIESLVVRVLAAEPHARAATLEQLAAEHGALADEVRRRVELLGDMGMLAEPEADRTAAPMPERLGEFQLLERLGQGGMGVVYRARQVSLEREVALKIVRPEQLWFEGARERFRREVTTVARLSHPGIVPVHAVGEQNGVPYFAMELVRGSTLADALAELEQRDPARLSGADLRRAVLIASGDAAPAAVPQGELPALFRGTWEQTGLRIVRAVAEALEHAHRSGILHRDLKPSNIMVTPTGHVMLVDFGLSSDDGAERVTRTGSEVGSLPYMAPELLAGEARPSRRSEVYGLGVTLYEFLTLRLPYAGSTRSRLRARVIEASAVPVRELNPGVAWEAETVTACAMDVDPARRYATVADLALDLSNVLEQRPIVARRPGPLLRARRFAERHPAWSVAVLVLLLAMPATWAMSERGARTRIEAANAALSASLLETRRAESSARRSMERSWGAVEAMLARVGSETLIEVPGVGELRKELLQDALGFHAEIEGDGPRDPRQRLLHARTFGRLAALHGWLGEYREAGAAFTEQRAILEELCAPGGGPQGLRVDLARTWTQEAKALALEGRLHAAESAASESLGRLAQLEGESPGLERALGEARFVLGDTLRRRGLLDAAEQELLAALASFAHALAEAPHDHELLGHQARTLRTLAGARLTAPKQLVLPESELVQSRDWLLTALAGFERRAAARPGGPEERWDVADVHLLLAYAHQSLEEFEPARAAFEASLRGFEALQREHPLVPRFAEAVARVWHNLAEFERYFVQDELASLEPAARAVATYDALLRAHPDHEGYAQGRFLAVADHANALSFLGEHQQSIPALRRAISDGEGLLDGRPLLPDVLPRLDLLRGRLFLDRLAVEGPGAISAEALDALEGDDSIEAGRAAWALAGCAYTTRRDAGLEPVAREAAAQEYSTQAIEALARALDLGLERERLESLLADREWWDEIRRQPLFQELSEAFDLPR